MKNWLRNALAACLFILTAVVTTATMQGSAGGNVSVTNIIEDYWVQYARNQILDTYSVTVQDKYKPLFKFGASENLSTTETTLWEQGGQDSINHETLVSTNLITHASSTDGGDTQDLKIEGHTCSGGDKTFVVQDFTLAGQTKTALSTPLCRSTRVYNNDSTDLAGTVFVYEDVAVSSGAPSDKTKVHLRTRRNQSQKAATAISSVDYWAITGITLSVNKKTSATVDFYLQIALNGKVFRDQYIGSSNSASPPAHIPFRPYLIAPANSDIRVTGIASTSSTAASAEIQGFLFCQVGQCS